MQAVPHHPQKQMVDLAPSNSDANVDSSVAVDPILIQ